MKKTLVIFIAVLLIFTLSPSIYAEAAYGPGSAVISISSADNIKPGEEFTLTAAISGDYQIHVAHISFQYDVNTLEIVSGTANGDFTSAVSSSGGLAMIEFYALADQGRIKVGLAMTNDAFTGDYEMFDVTFRAKECIAASTQITVEVIQFGYMPLGTTMATTVKSSVINGEVTFTAPWTGDATPTPMGSDITVPTPTDAGGEESTPTPGTIIVTPVPTDSGNAAPTPEGANPDGSTPEPGTTPGANEPELTDIPNASAPSLPELATKLPDADDAQSGSGSGNTLLIVLICVAAAAAIGAVIFIILGKKNKKSR